MTPRLTSATMLVLPWDAGACASMHSVLLSTQVSYTRDHTVPGRSEQCITSFSGLTLHLFVMLVSLGNLFTLQPYWRNWRSVSLSALYIFSPTWHLV